MLREVGTYFGEAKIEIRLYPIQNSETSHELLLAFVTWLAIYCATKKHLCHSSY